MMKKKLIFATSTVLFVLSLVIISSLQSKVKAGGNSSLIKWISWEEAQEKMKENPKKVYIDVYTNWCGWCKVMDNKTFNNKEVANYLNENFYCIKFNAESRSPIVFKGKEYKYLSEYKTHELALEIMRNKLSYPTSVIFSEGFENPNPIPGYLDIKTMEMILTFIGEEKFKQTSWENYQKDFKPNWN